MIPWPHNHGDFLRRVREGVDLVDDNNNVSFPSAAEINKAWDDFHRRRDFRHLVRPVPSMALQV